MWRRLAMALLVAALMSTVGACSSLLRERVCSRGERAVRAIEAPETGRTCVKNGQPPPPGYEEFPAGQRPTYVDDPKAGPRRQPVVIGHFHSSRFRADPRREARAAMRPRATATATWPTSPDRAPLQ